MIVTIENIVHSVLICTEINFGTAYYAVILLEIQMG